MTRIKTAEHDRTKSIGSSEIAAVLGVSKYTTPLRLYRIKKGLEPEPAENPYMTAGKLLEDAVARYFELESGHRVIKRSAEEYVVIDKQHQFLTASPDREYTEKGFGRCIVECKTTQRNIYKEDVPMEWFCQLQWQLGVTGIKRGCIAWLSRGLNFDYVEFDFDPDFFAKIKQAAVDFWNNHIVPSIEPPIQEASDVDLVYPDGSRPASIEADESLIKSHTMLRELQDAVDSMEAQIAELKDAVKVAMLDNDSVFSGDVKLFSWKTSKKSVRVDAKKLKELHPKIYAKVAYESKPPRVFRTL